MVPLPGGYSAPATARAVTEALARQPEHMVKTLTWDQGREMARWADIEKTLGIEVYFCEPRSPWQQPANEQTTDCSADGSPNQPTSTSDQYTSPSSKTTSTQCPENSTTGTQPKPSTMTNVATTNRACRVSPSTCPTPPVAVKGLHDRSAYRVGGLGVEALWQAESRQVHLGAHAAVKVHLVWGHGLCLLGRARSELAWVARLPAALLFGL